jgi:hypothetical protein
MALEKNESGSTNSHIVVINAAVLCVLIAALLVVALHAASVQSILGAAGLLIIAAGLMGYKYIKIAGSKVDVGDGSRD